MKNIDDERTLVKLKFSKNVFEPLPCFKYLGTVMETEGGSSKAVKQRVKSAWMKWREMSGVICDRKMPMKLKSKI